MRRFVTRSPRSVAASRRPDAGWAWAWRPSHVARRLRRAVGLPERDGLLVREVEEDSPAAKAGIAEGDLIVAVGGTPITSADDLFDALAGEGALEITLVRGADELKVTVPA